MPDAPKNAQDYLRDNPDLWRDYRSKYGSLPEGFQPPSAPQAALDYLRGNPDLEDDFVEKYGYKPGEPDEMETPQPETTPIREEMEEEGAIETADQRRRDAAVGAAGLNLRFGGGRPSSSPFSGFDLATPDKVAAVKKDRLAAEKEEKVEEVKASLTPEVVESIRKAKTTEEKVKIALESGVAEEDIYAATRGAHPKTRGAIKQEKQRQEKVDDIVKQYKGQGRKGFDVPKGTEGEEGSWGELFNDITRNAPAMFGKQWEGLKRHRYSESAQRADHFRDQLEAVARIEGKELANSTIAEVAASAEGKSVPGYLADLGEQRASLAESDQEAAEQIEQYQRYLEAYHPRTKENSAKWWIGAATDALINMGPAVGVGILTKNPNLSLALMGTQVFGDTYGQARSDGRSHDEASQDAFAAAVFEVAAEKIPLDYILKGGNGDKLLKRVLISLGMEGAEEVVTEALNMGYEIGILEEDITLGEAFTRLYQAGGIGAIVGGALATVTHPIARKAAAEQENADRVYKEYEEAKNELRDSLKKTLDPKQKVTRDEIAKARERYERAKMAIEDPDAYQSLVEQEQKAAEEEAKAAQEAAQEPAEEEIKPEPRLTPEETQSALQKIRDGESDGLSPDTLYDLAEQGFIKYDGRTTPRILPSGRRAAKSPEEVAKQAKRILSLEEERQDRKEARADIEPEGVKPIQEPEKVESAAKTPTMEETDATTLRAELDADEDVYNARTAEIQAAIEDEATDPAQRLAMASAVDARLKVAKNRDLEIRADQENQAWQERAEAKDEQKRREATKHVKQVLEAKGEEEVEMAEALSLFYEKQDMDEIEAGGGEVKTAVRQAFDDARKKLEAREKKAKAKWNKWFDKPTQGELFDIGEVVKRGTKQYSAAAEIGAYKMARGVIRIADWSAAMIEELGVRVKPALKHLYDDAKKLVTDSYRLSHKKYKTGKMKGQYKAAPKPAATPAKLGALRAKLRQLAGEGEPGRMWYEESGEEILRVAGGNMEDAKLLAGLLSIYSAGTAVTANTVNALKAWSQWKSGRPVKAGRFGHQDEVAVRWLESGEEPTGMKRSNFYVNLMRQIDPENFDVGQGTTVDLWMMRAFGYETDSPTDAQYAFVQTELKKLADEMGWEPQQAQAAIWVAMKARWEEVGQEAKKAAIKSGVGVIRTRNKAKYLDAAGEMGSPEYIKNKEKLLKLFRDLALKVPHGIAKREVVKSKASFKDTMELHYGVISWEAERSADVSDDHNLPLEARVEIQARIAELLTNPETGRELLAEWLGLLGAEQFRGVGAWDLKIGAMNQNLLLMPQEHAPADPKMMDVEPGTRITMDGYAAIMGFLLEQDAVAWGRSFYATSKSNANGVEIDIDRPLKPYEAKKFYLEIVRLAQEQFGLSQEEAMEFAPIAMPWGFKVQSYNESVPNYERAKSKPDFHGLVVAAFENTFPGISYKAEAYRAQGNLVENNWTTDPNGENYEQEINSSQNPEVKKAFERAKRELAPEISRIRKEVAEKYGSEVVGRERPVAAPVSLDAVNSTDPEVRSKEILTRFGTITNQETNSQMRVYSLDELIDNPKLINEMLTRYGYNVEYFSFVEDEARGVSFRLPNLKGNGYDKNTVWIYDPRVSDGSFKGAVDYTRAWRISHEIAHGVTEQFMQEKYGDSKRYGRLGNTMQVERGKLGKQVMVTQKALTLEEAQRAVEWEDVAFRAQRMILQEMGVKITDEEYNLEANINLSDATYRVMTGDFNDPGDRGFLPTPEETSIKEVLKLLETYEAETAKAQGREATAGIDLAKWKPVSNARLKKALNSRKAETKELGKAGAPIKKARVTLVQEGEVLPRKPQNAMRFRHFGNNVVTELDPDFMGTGLKGAESRQGLPTTRVIAAYPEKGFKKEVGLGPYEYVIDVPMDQMYDANSDPLGLKKKAMVGSSFVFKDGNLVPKDMRLDSEKYQTLIKEAGFVGFYTPRGEGSFKGQARLFEKMVVKSAQESIMDKGETVDVSFSVSQDPQAGTDGTAKGLLRDSAGKVVRLFRGIAGLSADHTRLPNLVFTTQPYAAQDYAQTASDRSVRVDDGGVHGGYVVIANARASNPYRLGGSDEVVTPQQIDEIVREMPEEHQNMVIDTFLNHPSGNEAIGKMEAAIYAEGRDGTITWDDLLQADGAYQYSFHIADMPEFTSAIMSRGHDAIILRGPHNTADPAGVVPEELKDEMLANGIEEVRLFSVDQVVPINGVDSAPLTVPTALSAADNSRAGAFMQEWYDMTFPSGVDPDARSVNDGATAVVRPYEAENKIYIDTIESFERGQGYGNDVLKRLIELADKHQVTLSLLPHPFSKDPWSQDSLEDWYRRNGFEYQYDKRRSLMTRGPQASSSFSQRQTNEGRGVNPKRLRQLVDWMKRDQLQALPSMVDIRVVATVEDIPSEIRMSFGKMEYDRVEGLVADSKAFDRPRVYLVAANIGTEGNAIKVLLHESVGHVGTRVLLGGAYNSIMDSIWNEFQSEVRAAAKRNKIDVKTYQGRRKAAEEFIAYTAGEILTSDKKAELPGFMERLVRTFKRILIRMGWAKPTDRDILSIIASAARVAGRGGRMRDAFRPAYSTKAPKFFSQLWNTVNEKGPGAMPAKNVVQTIEAWQRKGMFKKEEMEWLGLSDYFSKPISLGDIIAEFGDEAVSPVDAKKLVDQFKIDNNGEFPMNLRDAFLNWRNNHGGKQGGPHATSITKTHILGVIKARALMTDWRSPLEDSDDDASLPDYGEDRRNIQNNDFIDAFNESNWELVPFSRLGRDRNDVWEEIKDEFDVLGYVNDHNWDLILGEQYPGETVEELSEEEVEDVLDAVAERIILEEEMAYKSGEGADQVYEKEFTLINPRTDKRVTYTFTRADNESPPSSADSWRSGYRFATRNGRRFWDEGGIELDDAERDMARAGLTEALMNGDILREGGIYQDYSSNKTLPYMERLLVWDGEGGTSEAALPEAADTHYSGNVIGHSRMSRSRSAEVGAANTPNRLKPYDTIIVDEVQSDAYQGLQGGEVDINLIERAIAKMRSGFRNTSAELSMFRLEGERARAVVMDLLPEGMNMGHTDAIRLATEEATRRVDRMFENMGKTESTSDSPALKGRSNTEVMKPFIQRSVMYNFRLADLTTILLDISEEGAAMGTYSGVASTYGGEEVIKYKSMKPIMDLVEDPNDWTDEELREFDESEDKVSPLTNSAMNIADQIVMQNMEAITGPLNGKGPWDGEPFELSQKALAEMRDVMYGNLVNAIEIALGSRFNRGTVNDAKELNEYRAPVETFSGRYDGLSDAAKDRVLRKALADIKLMHGMVMTSVASKSVLETKGDPDVIETMQKRMAAFHLNGPKFDGVRDNFTMNAIERLQGVASQVDGVLNEMDENHMSIEKYLKEVLKLKIDGGQAGALMSAMLSERPDSGPWSAVATIKPGNIRDMLIEGYNDIGKQLNKSRRVGSNYPLFNSWQEALLKNIAVEAHSLGAKQMAIVPGAIHTQRYAATTELEALEFTETTLDEPMSAEFLLAWLESEVAEDGLTADRLPNHGALGVWEVKLARRQRELALLKSKLKNGEKDVDAEDDAAPILAFRPTRGNEQQLLSGAEVADVADASFDEVRMVLDEKALEQRLQAATPEERRGFLRARIKDVEFYIDNIRDSLDRVKIIRDKIALYQIAAMFEEYSFLKQSQDMKEKLVRDFIESHGLEGAESLMVVQSDSLNRTLADGYAMTNRGAPRMRVYPGNGVDKGQRMAAARSSLGGFAEAMALEEALNPDTGDANAPEKRTIYAHDLGYSAFYANRPSTDNQERAHGLRTFYDEMLPLVGNKVFKKYGMKATRDWVEIDATAAGAPELLGAVDEGFQELRMVNRVSGEVNEDVEEVMEALNSGAIYAEKYSIQAKLTVFKFTDKLTKAMDETGLPAFSARQKGKPDAVDRFFKKIGKRPARQSLKDYWVAIMHRLGERFRVESLDSLYSIFKAEQEQGISPPDSGYISARLAASSESLIRGVLEYGSPIWREGAADLDTKDGGLLDVFSGLHDKAKMKAWLGWMVARRANRLKQEDREKLFTQEEIDAMLAYPDSVGWQAEFEKIAEDYAVFKKRLLDFAEEAGVVNKETRPLWEHADHIPFYRVLEADNITGPFSTGAIGNVRKQIHRLRGGSENIRDPLENILINMANLVDASLKNHATRLIHKNLSGTGLIVDAPSMVVQGQATVNMTEIKERLNEAGVSLDAVGQEMLEGFGKLLSFGAPAGENVGNFLDNGKKKYFYTMDPLIQKGLNSIREQPWSWLMWILRAPKRIGSHAITIVADFILKNWFRDMWHAFALSRDPRRVGGVRTGVGILPGWDSVTGAVSALRKDETFIRMMAGGGAFESGYVNAHDPAAVAKVIRGRLAARGFKQDVLDTPRKLFEFYRNLSTSAENSHRVQVYRNAIAAGKTHKEASFEGRDLMDFSMRGSHGLTRFLSETVMFLNARAQGLYRTGKGFRDNPYALVARGIPLLIASVALALKNWDDDRFKAMEDWERAAYYHFFDVFEKGDHYRLPKPFEIGAVFSTIPEIAAIHMMSQEPDKGKYTSRALSHLLTETLNLSPQIQALTPIYELAINESLFTTRPIVTDWEEKGMIPEMQKGATTSPVIVAIAEAMPDVAPEALRSPKKLQHLFQGYFTSLGMYGLTAADYLWYQMHAEENGLPPRMRTDELPLVRSFVRGTEGPKYTRFLNGLYSTLEEADRMHYSIKKMMETGDMEMVTKATKLREENAALLASRPAFNKGRKKLAKINKAIRAIYVDPNMKPEEKREQIDELIKTKNDIAKELWGVRPGGPYNPYTEMEGKNGPSEDDLIGMNQRESAEALKAAGYPRTGQLVASVRLSRREIDEINRDYG